MHARVSDATSVDGSDVLFAFPQPLDVSRSDWAVCDDVATLMLVPTQY